MRKVLLNSSIAACLLTALVSLWIVANPVPAQAASSSATCANQQQIYCQATNSQCFAIDSLNGTPGGCVCYSNDPNVQSPTDQKFCTDSDEEPYIE
jgi:hypothetical protein